MDKQFQDRLKKFFKSSHSISSHEFKFSTELRSDLSASSDLATRLHTLADVADSVVVDGCRLDDGQMIAILADICDILQLPGGDDPTSRDRVSDQQRAAVLSSLKAIVKLQRPLMSCSREHVLLLVAEQASADTDQLPLLIDLISALTDTGRDLACVEESVLTLLATDIMSAVYGLSTCTGAVPRHVDPLSTSKGTEDAPAACSARFFQLLQNCVKFNAAFLSPSLTRNIVQQIYLHGHVMETVESGLTTLDVLICYADVPRSTLVKMSALLARLVCCAPHTKHVWRITRNLLGTSQGPLTLQVLTLLMTETANSGDATLLKGCVFLCAMALWGGDGHRVENLRLGPSVVLPAFQTALATQHPTVVHEVILALSGLVRSPQSSELLPHGWELLLQICDSTYRSATSSSDGFPADVSAQLIHLIVQLLLEAVRVRGRQRMSGDHALLDASLQLCAAHLPAEHVASQLKQLAERHLLLLTSSEDAADGECWLSRLNQLVQRYFVEDSRPAVRLAVCDVVERVWSGYRSLDAAGILSSLVLPVAGALTAVAVESQVHAGSAASSSAEAASMARDGQVLQRVVRLLVSVATSGVQQLVEDAVAPLQSLVLLADESHQYLSVAVVAAEALLTVFEYQLRWQLSGHTAAGLLHFMMAQLLKLYQLPAPLLSQSVELRGVLLDWLLRLRSDSDCRVGLASSAEDRPVEVVFGRFLVLNRSTPPLSTVSASSTADDGAEQLALVNLGLFQSLLSTALRQERDFFLLKNMLTLIARMLQCKALLVTDPTGDLDYLVSAVTDLSSQITTAFCASLERRPADLSSFTLQALLVPILASLTAFHANITAPLQKLLIVALDRGLRTRCAPLCVNALTVCAVAMREVMYKLIGDILRSLTKLSATVSLGNSLMELLSTLICLPTLYSSFNEEQYRSIFAIVLPFTNPAKFNHYVVSLAHHVLVMWFLKCKVAHRRALVGYIIHGLKTNLGDVQSLLETQRQRGEAQPTRNSTTASTASDSQFVVNEDSAGRRRSSSLSEQTSRSSTARLFRRSQEASTLATGSISGSSTTPTAVRHPPSSTVTQDTLVFLSQLTETCVDIMSRYLAVSYAVVKRTTPQMERRLCSGVSSTWIMSARYVTIRVAGCGGEVFGEGLCQRCYVSCRPTAASDSGGAAVDLRTGQMSPPLRHDQHEKARRRHTSVPVIGSTILSQAAAVRPAGVGSSQQPSADAESTLCGCWCDGWGEVVVRRPAGNMSWLMRVRNQRLVTPAPSAGAASLIEGAVGDGDVTSELKPPTDGSGEAAGVGRDSTSYLLNRSGSESHRLPLLLRSASSQAAAPSSVLTSTAPSRDRSFTVSGSSAGGSTVAGRPRSGGELHVLPPAADLLVEDSAATLLPEQIFLQLFHSPEVDVSQLLSQSGGDADEATVEEPPALLLERGVATERSLSVFDQIPAREAHKLGVLYIGPGQLDNEAAILRNRAGSERYNQFIQGLGHLINIRQCDSSSTYLGGLSQGGEDGDFAIVWEDHLLQVIFHVATMIPVRAKDERCGNKKSVIGNDFVVIVYNESGDRLQQAPLSGQFGYACVVAEPLPHGLHRLSVTTKPILQGLFGHAEVTLVSDQNVSLAARQLALHANLASLIHRYGQTNPEPYASNWLERLRFIRRHRLRQLAARRSRLLARRSQQLPTSLDFTGLIE